MPEEWKEFKVDAKIQENHHWGSDWLLDIEMNKDWSAFEDYLIDSHCYGEFEIEIKIKPREVK